MSMLSMGNEAAAAATEALGNLAVKNKDNKDAIRNAGGVLKMCQLFRSLRPPASGKKGVPPHIKAVALAPAAAAPASRSRSPSPPPTVPAAAPATVVSGGGGWTQPPPLVGSSQKGGETLGSPSVAPLDLMGVRLSDSPSGAAGGAKIRSGDGGGAPRLGAAQPHRG